MMIHNARHNSCKVDLEKFFSLLENTTVICVLSTFVRHLDEEGDVSFVRSFMLRDYAREGVGKKKTLKPIAKVNGSSIISLSVYN